jgi:hypothetical protein
MARAIGHLADFAGSDGCGHKGSDRCLREDERRRLRAFWTGAHPLIGLFPEDSGTQPSIAACTGGYRAANGRIPKGLTGG